MVLEGTAMGGDFMAVGAKEALATLALFREIAAGAAETAGGSGGSA